MAWSTSALDTATLTYVDSKGATQTTTFDARIFATPLYLDDLTVSTGVLSGASTSVVVAATTNGYVYAIAAVDTALGDGVVPAGTILWRTQLAHPEYVPVDQGTPLGVLSTPILDRSTTPPTLYVTSADASDTWRVYALDLSSGAVLAGWPVAIDREKVSALDGNGPPGGVAPPMAPPSIESQRAALALSNGVLFIGFASYYDGAIGWMVAVDVNAKSIVASFSGSPALVNPPSNDASNFASAGMWGPGGPAVGSDGRVFVTTGNSPASSIASPGVWGNSLLSFNPNLTLSGTYSPFNYCLMDLGDTDLGGSSPSLIDLDPSLTSTPHLAVLGGKQGVVYLVDRDHLGGTAARPACVPVAATEDPSSDTSLFGPDLHSEYDPPSRGPLPVFGPYSEVVGDNEVNHAKMRTTPSIARSSTGDYYVYFAGTSRDPSNLDAVVPPCVARLALHLEPGAPAYLDATTRLTNTSVVFSNPGSPIVTSHDEGRDPVVWILDQNATRGDPTLPKANFTPKGAVLHAFDGTTLEELWHSAPADLGPSGKYAHVVVAHGVVYVGTDRISAFVPR